LLCSRLQHIRICDRQWENCYIPCFAKRCQTVKNIDCKNWQRCWTTIQNHISHKDMFSSCYLQWLQNNVSWPKISEARLYSLFNRNNSRWKERVTKNSSATATATVTSNDSTSVITTTVNPNHQSWITPWRCWCQPNRITP